MSQPWTPDHPVSPELARQLIEELTGQSIWDIRLLSQGWDNAAYLVDEEYVFRFPQRELAAGLIENESRVLPLIADRLPCDIPKPIFSGHIPELHPYPFLGAQMIEGETACRAKYIDFSHSAYETGEFLRDLHDIPLTDLQTLWAPRDDLRRADLSVRIPRIVGYMDELVDSGEDVPPFIDLLEEASGLFTPEEDLCWVHGDLYARHLVIYDGLLNGVIDWGDVHYGDRAIDLSIAYSFFSKEERAMFFAAYGEIDESLELRAKVKALHYAGILIPYAKEINDRDLLKAGRKALEFLKE